MKTDKRMRCDICYSVIPEDGYYKKVGNKVVCTKCYNIIKEIARRCIDELNVRTMIKEFTRKTLFSKEYIDHLRNIFLFEIKGVRAWRRDLE
ncbi:MAG TPA: hypothetical protein ENG45_00520 [Candidatus Aenigmarchaeota archaeon]|nr:hypothetical protein [Candidatus Aenigmarchaeota archaeon]